MIRRTILSTALALLATIAAAQSPPDPRAAALSALKDGGAVVLIRHALAPGTGDPPGFRLGECATQRNLSEAGRQQAVELGRRLREAGMQAASVRTSRWCRGRDTAALAFPDRPAEADPTLDSFVGDRGSAPRQTDELRALVAGWRGREGALVLVTHQVNITALTTIFPAEGEIVVVRPRADGFEVVGRARM